jgi:hypothetical protein
MVGTLRNPSGVVVVARVANVMSSATGLETGDVIHSVNQTSIDSLSSLRAALNQIKPHDPVVPQVERGGGFQWMAFEMEQFVQRVVAAGKPSIEQKRRALPFTASIGAAIFAELFETAISA